MASNELIVDDDYCKAMGVFFEKQGEELDQLVAEYISVLQDVKNKGIMGGDVSDVFGVYIEYVKKINNMFGKISISNKTQIKYFLQRVDEEDKYLF